MLGLFTLSLVINYSGVILYQAGEIFLDIFIDAVGY
jgi:hypothetical protein